MQGHFWHQFLTQFCMLFHMVPSVLLSMVAQITTYFKESDWLLKNLHQSESGWKTYHGEQNGGYLVKEHIKLCQKQLSKVTLHFVWGQLSRKQTVGCLLRVVKCDPSSDDFLGIKQSSLFTQNSGWNLGIKIETQLKDHPVQNGAENIFFVCNKCNFSLHFQLI